MANEIMRVTDPLGKTIFLLPGLCADENEEQEIYDDATTVIEKPAMLIESRQNDETSLYYFRSVGWHNTLLITVKLKEGRWEACECKKNPSSQDLSALLKKGKQII